MLTLIETLWWLLFWTAFGLCVGSFLNVVTYRIPHELTIGQPIWSFCPSCNCRIRWYDNIPLISYLRLGGRCRACDTSISARYPLIEAAAAVAVLVVLDAFFIDQTRAGLNRDALGLTWRLAEDWPIFLAHVILFACFLAVSAIDVEHYWIDTAITRVAVVGGFVLHTLWTPDHSVGGSSGTGGWSRPWDSTAAVCLAALVGLGLVALAFRRLGRDNGSAGEPGEDTQSNEDVARLPDESGDAGGAASPVGETDLERTAAPMPGSAGAPARGLPLAWMLVVGLVTLIVVLALAGAKSGLPVPKGVRLGVPLAGFFVLIVALGSVSRTADREILEAIDAERPWARKMVLQELAWLSPAIVLAIAALLAYRHTEGTSAWWSLVLHWRPIGDWQPLLGFATAATGYAIAAGIGWSVRIVATLVCGREAFGDGDIHLMAAAGCVAGWPVVLLGFVITCFLAIAGWLLALPFKRTRAIPLVPWLSLSFLITVVFYDRFLQLPPVKNVIYVANWLAFENSQAFGAGGLP